MRHMAARAIGRIRNVLLASADSGLRQRLRSSLSRMRWHVREAKGGADAMAQIEEMPPEALVVDSWLPDLEVREFAKEVHQLYPDVDVLRMDGETVGENLQSPCRNELLHAVREAQNAVSENPPTLIPLMQQKELLPMVAERSPTPSHMIGVNSGEAFPEMVGRTAPMLELARMIQLVAPTTATVLIEGETGTGKEVVAKAVHRLSARSSKPFTVLNCAAIPEALLEAELFGHTRGAFTGAVTSRTGRIEAAHGGILFLDEIGEMPLLLQSKMLRFLECGELQRVGDNETMRVDVRVIAATHQNLEKGATSGTFRLDLYHRLAVFPLEVPALRDRMEDLPLLAEYLLAEMGKESPRKHLATAALERLYEHNWPGNVRELGHVLRRAAILSGDVPEIGPDEIRYRRTIR